MQRVNRKREKLVIKGKLEQIRQRLLIIAMKKLWRKKRSKFEVIKNKAKKQFTSSKLTQLMDLNQRIGLSKPLRDRSDTSGSDSPEIRVNRSRTTAEHPNAEVAVTTYNAITNLLHPHRGRRRQSTEPAQIIEKLPLSIPESVIITPFLPPVPENSDPSALLAVKSDPPPALAAVKSAIPTLAAIKSDPVALAAIQQNPPVQVVEEEDDDFQDYDVPEINLNKYSYCGNIAKQTLFNPRKDDKVTTYDNHTLTSLQRIRDAVRFNMDKPPTKPGIRATSTYSPMNMNTKPDMKTSPIALQFKDWFLYDVHRPVTTQIKTQGEGSKFPEIKPHYMYPTKASKSKKQRFQSQTPKSRETTPLVDTNKGFLNLTLNRKNYVMAQAEVQPPMTPQVRSVSVNPRRKNQFFHKTRRLASKHSSEIPQKFRKKRTVTPSIYPMYTTETVSEVRRSSSFDQIPCNLDPLYK